MFSVHWFAVTVFLPFEGIEGLWTRFFASFLGSLVEVGHGARRYKQIASALLGAKVYYDYAGYAGEQSQQQQHCHIELTGSACECLPPTVYRDFVSYLQSNNIRFAIKRIDFAFDAVPFSPADFYAALLSDKLVSLIKRNPALNNESIRKEEAPLRLRDNGEVGTMTVYAGSRSSARMIRVYNKRGDTRLEYQMRDERAHAVCLDVFALPFSSWQERVKSHIRQFVDFLCLDWWDTFVSYAVKANLIISSARRVSLAKMEHWIYRQVSVVLSVIEDVRGREEARYWLANLTNSARKLRDRSRYKPVLQLV